MIDAIKITRRIVFGVTPGVVVGEVPHIITYKYATLSRGKRPITCIYLLSHPFIRYRPQMIPPLDDSSLVKAADKAWWKSATVYQGWFHPIPGCCDRTDVSAFVSLSCKPCLILAV